MTDEHGRDAQGRLPLWPHELRDVPILFEPHKLHRGDDPITSHDAALAAGHFTGRHHRIILDDLRSNGPATSEEIATRTGLDYWAVARRMGELRSAALVIQTHKKRRNKSGRMAFVWAAARPKP